MYHEEENDRFALLRPVVGAILLIVCRVLTATVGLPLRAEGLLMALAALWPLIPVLREAMEEWHDRTIGENTLLVIAVIAAFAIGEWVEGVVVLVLFDLGEWLEDKAVDYSRDTIASLAAVTPDTARRIGETGAAEEIPATAIVAGDRLQIAPHSRVPADCRITDGRGTVDTAALTGESEPVTVGIGDKLLSGTVNGADTLVAEALRPAAESAAARILHLVEESAAHKGRSERFITRFARVYTPVVTGLAVLVAVVFPLFGGDWGVWLRRALVFLVAACPCALVLSIPLCFYAGIAAAARRGILIKGGCFIETVAKLTAVAFDKTGTLTADARTLTAVKTADGVTEAEAMRLAAAVERLSAHPTAKAICAAAGTEIAAPDVTELAGVGVVGSIDGNEIACGGLRMLEKYGVREASLPDEWRGAPVFLLRDGVPLAAFLMDAALQEGADTVAAGLARLGVTRLTVLTGDRRAEAERVAQAVGIGHVRAELLPEDKLAAVTAWQAEGETVAFVGDGINDAPVLAAADLGVAMGLGSPAAIETADAVLVAGGVARLPQAIRLSRRVMRTVWENIAFSLAVKAVVLVLAVLGSAPMWAAAFADIGVMLLCVLNTLLILSRGLVER